MEHQEVGSATDVAMEAPMNALDPLVTVHAGMGAFRSVTPDLLAEVYLAPRPQSAELQSLLVDRVFPWSASMGVAAPETASAITSALRSVAMATEHLNPDEIDLSGL